MASRLILKDIKAPIHFLIRNPASSAPSRATAPLAQTIQNLPRQSAVEFSKSGIVSELGLIDRTLLSRDLKSTFDGVFRIEVRGKRESDIEDVDEMVESESESDLEDFDGFSVDCGEEYGGDFFDNDDAEPREDEF